MEERVSKAEAKAENLPEWRSRGDEPFPILCNCPLEAGWRTCQPDPLRL
jgi:hypothetical protein